MIEYTVCPKCGGKAYVQSNTMNYLVIGYSPETHYYAKCACGWESQAVRPAKSDREVERQIPWPPPGTGTVPG